MAEKKLSLEYLKEAVMEPANFWGMAGFAVAAAYTWSPIPLAAALVAEGAYLATVPASSLYRRLVDGRNRKRLAELRNKQRERLIESFDRRERAADEHQQPGTALGRLRRSARRVPAAQAPPALHQPAGRPEPARAGRARRRGRARRPRPAHPAGQRRDTQAPPRAVLRTRTFRQARRGSAPVHRELLRPRQRPGRHAPDARARLLARLRAALRLHPDDQADARRDLGRDGRARQPQPRDRQLRPPPVLGHNLREVGRRTPSEAKE